MRARWLAAAAASFVAVAAVAGCFGGPGHDSGTGSSGRVDLYGDPLPAGAIARCGTIRLRHGNPIRALAFLPDGRGVLSGAKDGTVRVWDVASGRQLRLVAEHPPGPVPYAFSPDRRVLATSGHDGLVTMSGYALWCGRTVQLRELGTGKLMRTLRGHEGGVIALSFSPDGRQVASAGSDATVRVWDVANGEEIRVLHGHQGDVLSVAYSPDGRWLATGGVDRTVRVHGIATSGEMRLAEEGQGEILSLAFSPDGRVLASGDSEAALRLWEMASGRIVRTLHGHRGPVGAVALSPVAGVVASAGGHAIHLWGPAGERPVRTFETASDDNVEALAFSPDGRLLAAGDDLRLRIWEVGSGRELHPSRGHGLPVGSVAFSPDGKMLASGGEDGVIRLWDARSGRETGPALPQGAGVLALAFSRDGRFLVSGGGDGGVSVWDVRAGRRVHSLLGHEKGVLVVAVSPDGRRILSAGYDHTVRVWDAATGLETLCYRGHGSDVTALVFSPDGSTVVSGGRDSTVQAWDPESGTPRDRRAWEPSVWTDEFAISPAGDRAAWGGGHALRCFGIAAGTEPWKRELDGRPVSALAFSPDGTVLASATWGRAIRLWAAPTGSEIRSYRMPPGVWAQRLAYSPDGKRLASANRDGTVLVWDVAGATGGR